MDTHIAGSISIMVFLVVMSAYFSATETAFSSMNRTRMQALADRGNKRAKLALELSDQYDKLLTTILIGNNIVNISLTAVSTVFFVALLGDLGATLSTVIITIVVLIFGEISPKSLAKEAPESFARFSAPILRLLMILLTPVNWLFSQWKKLLSRLLRVREDRRVTEAELLILVDEAANGGGIDEQDSELIHSVIEFNDLEAYDIYTPRVDVVGIPLGADNDEIARLFGETAFSRLPVYKDSLDDIVGVLHLKDFYCDVRGKGMPLLESLQKAVFVTPTMKISDLLRMLQKHKAHMAVVTDEYGGTMGIVTMEDILEQLVGEIWDEHDEIVVEFRDNPDGSASVAGSAEVEKFLQRFSLSDPQTESSTVSGWIMEQLGHIPNPGESFEFAGRKIVVSAADNKRVTEILIFPQSEPASDQLKED